jgi:hypothetical protein
MRGVNQGDVRKCLRKIPDQALVPTVKFFSQQANVITQRQQPFEYFSRPVYFAQ